MNTINAMKQAAESMERARAILTDNNPRPKCNWGMLDTTVLRQAISNEEAQTAEAVPCEVCAMRSVEAMSEIEEAQAVEPRAWDGFNEATKRQLYIAGGREIDRCHERIKELEAALFTHPAPPPSGDREEMIAWLRNDCGVGNWYSAVMQQAADMLAADAQRVVVPQGWKLVPVGQTTQAANDVLAERHRQISIEGWTPEHDDTHSFGEMARAGAAYAAQSLAAEDAELDCNSPPWWPHGWTWKPSSRRRMLVKGAALILAEIERIDRAILDAAPQPPQAERVPMTEEKMIGIMEKLGITVCGPASEAIEALIHAVEAHHHIGVKP